MTVPEYEKMLAAISPYERLMLEEFVKLRKAVEALKED